MASPRPNQCVQNRSLMTTTWPPPGRSSALENVRPAWIFPPSVEFRLRRVSVWTLGGGRHEPHHASRIRIWQANERPTFKRQPSTSCCAFPRQQLARPRLWQLAVNPLHGLQYPSGLRLVSDVACWQFPRLGRSRRGLAGLLGLPCALQEVAHEIAVHRKILWLGHSTSPPGDHVYVAPRP